MAIKAIETKYKGYRFRSRLEARWAVFFDELEVPWKYESEGYDLDGIYYLPDFCVRTKDGKMQFVEVKPEKGMTDEEVEKAKRLALKYDGSDVFVVMGDPMEHSMKFFYGDSEFATTDGLMIMWDRKVGGFTYFDRSILRFVVEAENCKKYLDSAIEAHLNYRYSDAKYWANEATRAASNVYRSALDNELHPHPFAAQAARSARFEHGETPR